MLSKVSGRIGRSSRKRFPKGRRNLPQTLALERDPPADREQDNRKVGPRGLMLHEPLEVANGISDKGLFRDDRRTSPFKDSIGKPIATFSAM